MRPKKPVVPTKTSWLWAAMAKPIGFLSSYCFFEPIQNFFKFTLPLSYLGRGRVWYAAKCVAMPLLWTVPAVLMAVSGAALAGLIVYSLYDYLSSPAANSGWVSDRYDLVHYQEHNGRSQLVNNNDDQIRSDLLAKMPSSISTRDGVMPMAGEYTSTKAALSLNESNFGLSDPQVTDDLLADIEPTHVSGSLRATAHALV